MGKKKPQQQEALDHFKIIDRLYYNVKWIHMCKSKLHEMSIKSTLISQIHFCIAWLMRAALKVMNSFHSHKGLLIPFYVPTKNTENPSQCLAPFASRI